MDFDILFLFLMTSITLTLSPGPDILYVLSQSLNDGFRSGFSVSLGLVSGLFFHTAFIALGFGFLITEYPHIIKFIKYFGALYLIYIINAFGIIYDYTYYIYFHLRFGQ